jgi:hypothetical protein
MSIANSLVLHPARAPQKLPLVEDFTTIAIGVDFQGNALRLMAKGGSVGALAASGKTGGQEYSAILSVVGNSWSGEISITGISASFPHVDMLPGNQILVAASRCRQFIDGSHELNGTIYDQDGKPTLKLLLGDGIEHVQADGDGNVWVGYFDEGIFGNGWKSPVGAAGLCCFNRSGKKLWDFTPPAGFDTICDCYALNVARNGLWIYYYTEFPIAVVTSDLQARCWRTETSGARILAVDQDRVLLFGGYRDQRVDCKLLRLGDGIAEVAHQVSLVLPRSIDLRKDTVIGRDKQLHVFMDESWYVFSIDSVS